MKSVYNLYDLVKITIDERVNEQVHHAVDFQIRHFEGRSGEPTKYEINVLPYKDLHIPNSEPFDICYEFRGIPNRFVIDERNQIAIEKHNRGYTIWAQSGNFLITHFIQMLLQPEKIAFVHAGALADANGNAYLLAGAGGVGKTALIGRIVQGHRYKLLGDDIVAISDRADVFSFPRPFIIKDYHESIYPEIYRKYKKNRIEKGLTKIKTFIRLNAPFIDVLKRILVKHGIKESVLRSWHATSYLAAVPIEEIFGKDSICERAFSKHVIFLQRYSGQEFRLEPMPQEVLAQKLFSIISFEWAASHANAILLSLYGMEDFAEYWENVRRVIAASISHTKNHVLYIPETSGFPEMADFFEKHCLGL